MRFGKLIAVVATLIGGLAAIGATPSSAAPIGPGAVTGVKGQATVETVQYYTTGPVYRSGPGYRERRVHRERRVQRPGYGRPVYGRPVYGRPVYGRPVYGRPVYGRPVRRVVCTTRVRLIPTAYGYIRRPVRVCTRR
jgi:hypothetical protein